ncbi:hypothetical protein T439DRAFT_49231 [Meredithblackwellia eburnea MCA 4105]
MLELEPVFLAVPFHMCFAHCRRCRHHLPLLPCPLARLCCTGYPILHNHQVYWTLTAATFRDVSFRYAESCYPQLDVLDGTMTAFQAFKSLAEIRSLPPLYRQFSIFNLSSLLHHRLPDFQSFLFS